MLFLENNIYTKNADIYFKRGESKIKLQMFITSMQVVLILNIVDW